MEEKVESVMMKTQLCSFFARDICYLLGRAQIKEEEWLLNIMPLKFCKKGRGKSVDI